MSSSHPSGMISRISVDRFNEILDETTPIAGHLGIRAEWIGEGEARAHLRFSTAALRSGGAYSGPAVMALIDVSMYAAVLGLIGDDPRPVTSNIAITFLGRAAAHDLVAHCRLLNRDAEFIVGSIVVHPSHDATALVCTSSCTFALPVRAQSEF